MNHITKPGPSTLLSDDGPGADVHKTDQLSPGMHEVTVTNTGGTDQALKDAIAQVMDVAKRHKTGVMVTRIGIGRYVVRAHPAVPYGFVRHHKK